MLRLKFLRIDRGLSQQQLGDRTNVLQSDLSRFETGRGLPTDDELTAIALVLQCEPGRLMDQIFASGEPAYEYRDAQP